ncbi:hypothetical protein GCM10009840_17770 [Pseudolysinimonas kribbensis]|uniref:hypothetical protein n=1 Tax=Pseudolysinimonas kribbensis TaxID=433641 RepID=UPI0031CE9AD6
MTRRPGRALRLGWLALVAAIVCAGVVVVALPRAAPARADAPLPADLEGVAFSYCFVMSGGAAYGNLLVSVRVRDHRIRPTVGMQQPDAAPLAGHAEATPVERAAVLERLDRCLGPYRFATDSAAIRFPADVMRQYQYDVAVLWPCLRAHRIDPGEVPPPAAAGGTVPVDALAAAAMEGDRPLPEILRVAAQCPLEAVDPDASRP